MFIVQPLKGYLVLVGKDIELDVVSCQFEPYPYSQMSLQINFACRWRSVV